MKLREIAEKLGCTVEGDENLEITGVAGIGEAQPGELTFLVNRKYRPALETTRASAILIAPDEARPRIAALRSANPYLDFARAIEMFHPTTQYAPSVHRTAVIGTSTKIGAGAHIGPYCYVAEDVEIGANAVLHSFVSIYRGACGDLGRSTTMAESHRFPRGRHRVRLVTPGNDNTAAVSCRALDGTVYPQHKPPAKRDWIRCGAAS